MIYTELTEKAMIIAYNAHHGQVDYGNAPYIFHPYHVAEQMPDEISTCVALLHDVVEDTTVTLEELSATFPAEIVEAVGLLTHEKGTDYFEYVKRIKQNPIAVRVKLADIAHNSDETRLVGNPQTEERLLYWRRKYKEAKEILEDGSI